MRLMMMMSKREIGEKKMKNLKTFLQHKALMMVLPIHPTVVINYTSSSSSSSSSFSPLFFHFSQSLMAALQQFPRL